MLSAFPLVFFFPSILTEEHFVLCYECPSSRSAMAFSFSHSAAAPQRWFLPHRMHELSFGEGGGGFKVPILVLQRGNRDAEMKPFPPGVQEAQGWFQPWTI